VEFAIPDSRSESRNEILFALKSPVFMRISRASNKILCGMCAPGVAQAVLLCYKRKVSKGRCCRQRMQMF
jgi:hypothetical protein